MRIDDPGGDESAPEVDDLVHVRGEPLSLVLRADPGDAVTAHENGSPEPSPATTGPHHPVSEQAGLSGIGRVDGRVGGSHQGPHHSRIESDSSI